MISVHGPGRDLAGVDELPAHSGLSGHPQVSRGGRRQIDAGPPIDRRMGAEHVVHVVFLERTDVGPLDVGGAAVQGHLYPAAGEDRPAVRRGMLPVVPIHLGNIGAYVTGVRELSVRQGDVERVLPRAEAGRPVATVLPPVRVVRATEMLPPVVVPGAGVVADVVVVTARRLADPEDGGDDVAMRRVRGAHRPGHARRQAADHQKHGEQASPRNPVPPHGQTRPNTVANEQHPPGLALPSCGPAIPRPARSTATGEAGPNGSRATG